MSLKCFHWEPRQHGTTYERAVFCGAVDPEVFDWFFNATTGYRGAFFESPEVGNRENRLLVDGLTPFLAEWVLAQDSWHGVHRIRASLSKPSAKMWLAEYPGLCALCAGEWSSSYEPELRIYNSRWECSSHIHSAWGTHAPRMTKIRVFGGFMNADGNEWLASHKSERAAHIWEYGWS
jgi:hypothetical protein